MRVTIKEFYREYTRALREGYASIFAGAGLSRSSGFVNWKELLREIAEDINLNVDKESDLIALAQYYCNERGGRADINQTIINKFNQETSHNENIACLTRLPIATYWTTNYDALLEESLKLNNKKVDVKIHTTNLSTTLPQRDAVVYKMHGDISDPANAVISKDDYESYDLKRELFSTALKGDLVSKTFLFIGFSFQDPNLEYILSRIRVLLGKNQRSHYCFLKKVSKIEYDNLEDYNYALVKQDLQIKDLSRYSINVILVDSYEEITDILLSLERIYILNNVFISGSAENYGNRWKGKGERFSAELGKMLIKNNYKVISGIGHGVGSFVISGALGEIMENKKSKIDRYLCMRPFPYQNVDDENLAKFKTIYREDMIKDAGICLFLFGNKMVNGKQVLANGVREEFEISKKQNKYLIPIGSTGFVADEIFQELIMDKNKYWYLHEEFDTLNKSDKIDDVIHSILTIINKIRIQDKYHSNNIENA